MDAPTFHVACLCAAWCHLCEDYAPVLDGVLDEWSAAAVDLRRHWIDIEDEADLVGDFDVETFPTIVVVAPEGVRFAGPLPPQADTLRRLLRSMLDAAPGRSTAMAPEVDAFAERLRQRIAAA